MIESKTMLIAVVAVTLAAVAFGGAAKEGETVHLQDRDVFVRGPNYDKEKIAPYTLEDPLTFLDGRKVTKENWAARRKEILGIFAREMYGAEPPPPEALVTELVDEKTTVAGFGIRRRYKMHFKADRSGPCVNWIVWIPRHARKPAPVVLFLNYRGNHELVPDGDIEVTDAWLMSWPEKFGIRDHRANPKNRGLWQDPNSIESLPLAGLLAREYAVMSACYAEVSRDPESPAPGEDAYDRAFTLWGPRDPKRKDNTTALGAWGWALCRGLDLAERIPEIDAKKSVATGYSRLGKAALIAAARDARFAVCVPVQTGGGGAPLAKRDYGENVSTENRMFPHWYCPAYAKYAADPAKLLTFDQHLFLACIAPRALLVEGFDEKWFDTEGEYLAVRAASPVWELLTGSGMPKVTWPGDYDTSAIGARLGYVRRSEWHGMSAHDWKWMMDFADRALGKDPREKQVAPFGGSLDGLAVCAEQKSGSIVLVDASKAGAPAFAWEWNAKHDPGIDKEGVKWFRAPSDCRMLPGRVLLMTDSLGAFARIPLATGRADAYGYIGGNPHAAEQLPGGQFIVTASSEGNCITLFDISTHPMEPEKQSKRRYPFANAHGVVWDARRDCLWAIGMSNIVRFAWHPQSRELSETARFDFTAIAGIDGHDLQSDDRGGLLFSTNAKVSRFDPDTGAIRVIRDRKAVKSFSRNARNGDLSAVVREVWWTDRLLVDKDGREYVVGPYPGARFYKARWAATDATRRLAKEFPPTDRVTVRPETTREALLNPGMGWVYYHYDNSNWSYGADTASGDTLDWFPGVSTVYFRLPWGDLEPEEGDFRWDVIDSVAQPWIAAGKQIAFRLTCNESEYEWAVPRWLPKAGCKGRFLHYSPSGRRLWEPEWDDPVFLEKYGKFLAAAAKKWNGNPAVAFIDVGSFGMWGEGHTGYTSKVPPDRTRELAILHAKLLKSHFPDTPIVISDDVAGSRTPTDDDPCMRTMRELGIGLRDDSIMVDKRPEQWFHDGWGRKFAAAGLPVVVESRHFFVDKGSSSWYEGGLYDSTVAYQASFQGIHWWPVEFLRHHRAEVERVNLRLGYRFVLKEASWPRAVKVGEPCEVTATWVNAGVAAPREEVVAAWTLLDDKGAVAWTSVATAFDFRRLRPTLEDGEHPETATTRVRFGWDWPYCGIPGCGQERHHDGTVTHHGPKVPTIAPGEYDLCISLGRPDGTPRIALPLEDQVGKTRRYRLGRIELKGN